MLGKPCQCQDTRAPRLGCKQATPNSLWLIHQAHTYPSPQPVVSAYTWLRSRPNSLVRTKFCITSIMLRGEICASVS